ncbi:hypothetical protein B0H16DRAFT_1494100 [Mycena metata]|uniref:AAA protein C-terminal winged helix domain-containing protein n=1 Tax=Mycena metata TaxID=1033252 RepID=A0AAD7KC21_9AGAR|nr:hypothetical protein B0H16DRAFT_1494100 [Mycena metata]
MAAVPFRILSRHCSFHSLPVAVSPRTLTQRVSFGPRFYSTAIPPKPPLPPKVPPPPKVPTRPTRPEEHAARAEAHDQIDGSQAFQPQPFNVPGSPLFGGSSLRDAALTTVVGLLMVFVGGVAYVRWYKYNVLRKIENAFAAGYDPALELATYQNKPPKNQQLKEDTVVDLKFDEDAPWTEHLRRKEQDWIDAIVKGEEPGHYFVLLGPKGSGKGTMIFDAMTAIEADGVAMLDAHPDLEVFRLKLGKAINYEYNEDSQTGLFQRRDPREGGPALDIERAMNKLEKVALKAARRRHKPLVLIINNVHFFKNDDDGRSMLLQLQQRAEAWAASGIVTCVFMTDDFWPFYVMRKTASRMHVLSIYDLDNKEAMHAATRMHMSIKKKNISPSIVQEAINIVGGRLSYLNKVARSKDMIETANNILAIEKAWLSSQIGLIPDCDDDVMDEQKWSSCSWLLLREFVRIRKEQERVRDEAIAAGVLDKNDVDLPLPAIPYWRCRQIMTRADFLEDLDRANIIAIDVQHDVRPDSMLILHAARQVVEEEGFDELLDNVRDRIDEIESLHRTRELTFKDVDAGDKIRLTVDKGGARLV